MSRPSPAWFTDFGQGADAPVRLFAFAHAGGGSRVHDIDAGHFFHLSHEADKLVFPATGRARDAHG